MWKCVHAPLLHVHRTLQLSYAVLVAIVGCVHLRMTLSSFTDTVLTYLFVLELKLFFHCFYVDKSNIVTFTTITVTAPIVAVFIRANLYCRNSIMLFRDSTENQQKAKVI